MNFYNLEFLQLLHPLNITISMGKRLIKTSVHQQKSEYSSLYHLVEFNRAFALLIFDMQSAERAFYVKMITFLSDEFRNILQKPQQSNQLPAVKLSNGFVSHVWFLDCANISNSKSSAPVCMIGMKIEGSVE